MIDWLEIKQFAIAEHIEIEFDDRFTTVTGETGSGKSLIVDAMNILTGHRSDSSYIRHEKDKAELQAGFALTNNHPAQNWLTDQGLDNDGECIIRRVLRRDKASRGYINGHASTMSQLKELGKFLIDIHGQNEHHSLLQRSVQLDLLDHAANNTDRVRELAQRYEVLSDIDRQLEALKNQSHSNQERADMLKFQIEELNELAPVSGEWQALSVQQKRLNHLHELTSGSEQTASQLALADEGSIDSRLAHCIDRINQLSEFDQSLKTIAGMLNEALLNVAEAANQLRPYFQDQVLDKEEITQVENRFALFHSLARKHRIQPENLYEHLDALKQELSNAANPEMEIARLETEYELEDRKYQEIAEKLTQARKTASKRLSKEVTASMQELGLKGGLFEIQLNPVDNNKRTRFGNEAIEFIVTANPGMPPQPLGKVASGGELSRISLAIQVVLANKAQVGSLIFDEVDVGIGGEVANVVGQKLRLLGETCQVICVTHLSQVAAKGHHQFSVSKYDGDSIETRVIKLDAEQRIDEIARMTGGDNITDQSRAHAQQLLKTACACRTR